MADKFQVKKTDSDEFLTFDLGTSSTYFAPPACAYSFTRAVADRLAAEHGGTVGTLETVWGANWKATRTWTPAVTAPALRLVP